MLLNPASKIISSSCGEKNANVVLIMETHLLHLQGRLGGISRKLFFPFFTIFEDVFWRGYFHFKETLMTSKVAHLPERF